MSRSTSPPLGTRPAVGWFTCLVLPPRPAVYPPKRDRSLRFGIDLAVGGVERRQQQRAALQAGGIADGGDGDVNLRSRDGQRAAAMR